MANMNPKLNNFVGQRSLVEQLQDAVERTKVTGDPLPHMIFAGPAGLGKTRLCSILASEIGVDCREILGNGVTPLTMTDFICSTDASGYDENGMLVDRQKRKPSIRIFNECERLKTELFESVHGALEPDGAGRRFLPVKMPGQSKMEYAWVPDFTSVWVTNYTGKLRDKAVGVVSRCPIKYTFQPYDGDDMCKIILFHAKDRDIAIDKQSATMIADRAMGVPRSAVNLLERCQTRLIAMRARGETRTTVINESIVKSCLALLGIDDIGLDVNAVKYLKLMAASETPKLSLQTMASRLGLDTETVAVDIEPFLIQLGLINIVPGGRSISDKGLAHVGLGQASPVRARIVKA